MNPRVEAIKKLLGKAADRYGMPGIRNMPVNTLDRGNEDPSVRAYSMCYDRRRPEFKRMCGPDWSFISWRECNIECYKRTREEVIAAGASEPTVDKAVWYGNVNSPLKDVIEHVTRPRMARIGEANPDILDVRHVFPPLPSADPRYRSMADLVRENRALIDIGGNGFSARIKWLLFSRRPLLMVDRFYVDCFYEDLKSWEHYIPVRMDLSDLVEKTRWVLDRRDESRQIAENAFRFALENFPEDRLLARVRGAYSNFLQK